MPPSIRILLLGLLLPCSAFAADGVIEINQASALQGGVTPGDLPGFPVSLTQQGSYVLTSNLDLSGLSPNVHAIDTRIGMSIDLNGFTIFGPASCGGTPPVCGNTGNGDGINVQVTSNEVVEIRDGTIRNMGGEGIWCSRGCRVENVRAIENGNAGIHNSNAPGSVHRCEAIRNGGTGVSLTGTILVETIAYENAGVGLFLNPGVTAIGNHSSKNGGNGIRCAYCTLLDNTSASNTGFGADLFNASYGRNLFHDNVAGAITGSGNEVSPNTCSTGAAGIFACP